MSHSTDPTIEAQEAHESIVAHEDSVKYLPLLQLRIDWGPCSKKSMTWQSRILASDVDWMDGSTPLYIYLILSVSADFAIRTVGHEAASMESFGALPWQRFFGWTSDGVCVPNHSNQAYITLLAVACKFLELFWVEAMNVSNRVFLAFWVMLSEALKSTKANFVIHRLSWDFQFSICSCHVVSIKNKRHRHVWADDWFMIRSACGNAELVFESRSDAKPSRFVGFRCYSMCIKPPRSHKREIS